MNNEILKLIPSDLEVTKISKSRNGICFLELKGQENIDFIFRGEPKQNSPFSVVRAWMTNGRWLLDDSYINGDILNFHEDFQICTEGSCTNIESIMIHSQTQGWLKLMLINAQFSGIHTKIKVDARGNQHPHDIILDTPADINIVYLKTI